MVGNVWEWIEDCWEGDCGHRVVRGGLFIIEDQRRPGMRSREITDTRFISTGVRVARTLD